MVAVDGRPRDPKGVDELAKRFQDRTADLALDIIAREQQQIGIRGVNGLLNARLCLGHLRPGTDLDIGQLKNFKFLPRRLFNGLIVTDVKRIAAQPDLMGGIALPRDKQPRTYAARNQCGYTDQADQRDQQSFECLFLFHSKFPPLSL